VKVEYSGCERNLVDMNTMRLVGLGLTVIVMAGCSSTSDPTTPSSALPSAQATALTVSVVTKGASQSPVTLTCDPPGGSHSQAQAACAELDKLAQSGKDPFVAVSPDLVCAEIMGGPETATVTGTWRGVPVDAALRQTDSCESARWEQLKTLLGLD